MSKAATSKNKIKDFAAAFNMEGKDFVAILGEKGIEKKPTSTLEDEEINYIFGVLTSKNAVKNFDSYFAMGKEARKARSDKAADEKAEKEAKNLAAIEQILALKKAAEEAQKKAEQEAKEKSEAESADQKTASDDKPVKKPRTKKADTEEKTEKTEKAEKPAKTKKTAEKSEKSEKPSKAKETDKSDEPKEKPKSTEPNLNPFKKRVKPEKPEGPTPNRGPVRTVHVDTRSSSVDLEKYNEKYTHLASGSSNRYGNDSVGFKKIRQKSQNKKQGTKRETEADKLRRIQLERIKKTPIKISVGDEITVSELASRMKKTVAEVIKELMKLGVMSAANDTIDFDTASIVATEMGAVVEKEITVTIEDRIIDDTVDTEENLKSRTPVVVVMGHVDHGKTSILDAIRNTSVTATEAGGITQHIGAYKVVSDGNEITFLDTPGHAAFTSMRARGASVTDIAILVVAADDGIMPQTVEAINHAKAAKVQIIVAINKMDKPGANPDRIKQQLTDYELVPEEWGGDTICVPVSAIKGEGIDDLLKNVLLVAEMLELKANPDRAAKGAVIEARLDKGRGPVATLLVQNGTLHTGDIIVAGSSVGKVRVMTNDKGQSVKEAGPSTPVEITGMAEVPSAGDTFDAVSDERLARELVEQRKEKEKNDIWDARQKVTLDNLFDQMQLGDMKELNIVVKADVQGSVEAVTQAMVKLSNEEVRVQVIHGGVGAINESDVMLAHASNAIIVGFNVRPEPIARQNAERDGVDMRMYRIIYDCIDEISAALKGLLAPKFHEVLHGHAEVRQVYKISSAGTIAGCYITDGKVHRSDSIRVVRDGIVVAEDTISSLKRFKDDAKEVADGFECGIGLEKFGDIKEGDIFEAFVMEEYKD